MASRPMDTGAVATGRVEFETLRETVVSVGERAAARATEIDATGCLPEDLFVELEERGVMRCMLATGYGGSELSLREFNELLVEASRAYGSLGWVLMIAALTLALNLGGLPEPLARRILEENPNPRMRGNYAPKGRAIPVEGGYRVSGRWPFFSGGPAPDYISGNCIVFSDGKPRMLPNGMPDIVYPMLPADRAQRIETWNVLGMRATDSVDYEIHDEFVSREFVRRFADRQPPTYDSPLLHVAIRTWFASVHSAVAVGIARGALDDIIALSETKRASLNPSRGVLRDDIVFRHELGVEVVRLSAADGALWQLTDELWSAGVEERELSAAETLRLRLGAHRLTADCAAVVDWAYTSGGSAACYADSSLQRRMRDIHICTQHVQCHPDGYRWLGAALLGDEVPDSELA